MLYHSTMCIIMPCVPTYTHVIIISLWLICYTQCGFSISYLSIPGIAAHDKCIISHVSTFSFNFNVVLCLSFNYFWEDYKTIVRKGVPVSPFLRHPPFDLACLPFLKSLCPLPSVLPHPLLRYFRQFPPPSHKSLRP